MNKYRLRNIGPMVYWKDYVKITTDELGEPVYHQSNTPLDGFYERVIGLVLVTNKFNSNYSGKHYYVAVAADNGKQNKKKKNKNLTRIIVKNRIVNAIEQHKGEITPHMKGITVVPESYIDYLYKDKHVTDNLYGHLDPTLLEMAMAYFNEDK